METNQKIKLRKPTEREVFRLMGVDNQDIDALLGADIPMTELYRMAGNSIVVDVLFHLFRKMYIYRLPDKGENFELPF